MVVVASASGWRMPNPRRKPGPHEAVYTWDFAAASAWNSVSTGCIPRLFTARNPYPRFGFSASPEPRGGVAIPARPRFAAVAATSHPLAEWGWLSPSSRVARSRPPSRLILRSRVAIPACPRGEVTAATSCPLAEWGGCPRAVALCGHGRHRSALAKSSGHPRVPEVRGDDRDPVARLQSGVAAPEQSRCAVTAAIASALAKVEWLSPCAPKCAVTAETSCPLTERGGCPRAVAPRGHRRPRIFSCEVEWPSSRARGAR
jgi:hypothetical protein